MRSIVTLDFVRPFPLRVATFASLVAAAASVAAVYLPPSPRKHHEARVQLSPKVQMLLGTSCIARAPCLASAPPTFARAAKINISFSLCVQLVECGWIHRRQFTYFAFLGWIWRVVAGANTRRTHKVGDDDV